MIDPDTGLNYCKKHGWEQTKECVYCELDALRTAVKALVDACYAIEVHLPISKRIRDEFFNVVAAVERLEG